MSRNHIFLIVSALLLALDLDRNLSFEVVISGGTNRADTMKMMQAINETYFPNTTLMFKPDGDSSSALVQVAPFVKYQHMLNGKATAYVCTERNCKAPTTDINKMLTLLGARGQ